MPLKQDLQLATRKVFKAVNSVLTKVTYVSGGAVTYDPNTGTISSSPVTHNSVPVAFSSFKQNEVLVGMASGSNQFPQLVQPNDKKATISATEVVFKPKLTDRIEHDGEKWDVINVLTDSTGSVYILHLRRV